MAEICSIQEVVRYRLCISCGACVNAVPAGAIQMVFDEKSHIFLPKILDSACVSGQGLEFTVCPGKGLPINEIAEKIYGTADHNTFELGRYRLAIVARAVNQRILENASSGGVMTAIAHYLIEKGLIQGTTASRFVYGPSGPRTESFIARSLDALISAQGSKYCPTVTNQLVRECAEARGRYLFNGTPCQVGALRLAIREDPSLVEVFPYTMANFCGGYRDFRFIENLISLQGIDPSEVEYFRFRGGGQPGSMLTRTRDGQIASIPYPEYEHCSNVPKQKRCTYCIDATGELADFACGDAWIQRFLDDKYPWSIILARSTFAEEIIAEMAEKGLLKLEPVSFEEVCESQKSNITSKKFRQYKRMRLSRLWGNILPEWDTELPHDSSSYIYEMCVFFGKTSIGRKVLKIRRFLKKLLGR
jgi:coenzyme F420 hydrogenase subunit beta